MNDLSVVALDLITGREIGLINEGDVPYWRRRGHGGDATVVCLYCYTGADGPGRREVPVVARGRIGGARRAHFAHPPGMAPGHGRSHPETVWHAVGKQRLADWARQQPGVVDAVVEAWTRDGARRSDVQVCFRDGRRVALELQSRWVTDDEWLARHLDYTRNQITDVWLWHPRVGAPGIVADRGEAGWLLGEDHSHLAAVVARGHDRYPGWSDEPDPTLFGRHWPPCRGDATRTVTIPWTDLRLDHSGLTPAPELLLRWQHHTRELAARLAADPTAHLPGPSTTATSPESTGPAAGQAADLTSWSPAACHRRARAHREMLHPSGTPSTAPERRPG